MPRRRRGARAGWMGFSIATGFKLAVGFEASIAFEDRGGGGSAQREREARIKTTTRPSLNFLLGGTQAPRT